MTKKILVLLALLSVGITTVYAETSTVEVPFDYHGQSCWLESDTTYQCIWQGVIEPFTIEDLDKFKDVLSDEVYAEELAKLEAKKPVVIELPKLTPTEKQIEILGDRLNKGIADVDDSVLYHLLTQLDTCQQGMDSRTAPIQTAREFTISEFDLWKVNNVEYRNQIGEIVLAIEECRAQTIIYNYSAGYQNMPTGDDDVQYSLLTQLEGVQALDFELYTKNSKRVDMNGICDNNQYTWSNKIMMGCEDTRVYDGTTHKGTSGKITYFSGTIGEYQKYLNENSRYATTEDKKIQEQIAHPVLQEMLEENTWHDRE
jgi:hypothetical protein